MIRTRRANRSRADASCSVRRPLVISLSRRERFPFKRGALMRIAKSLTGVVIAAAMISAPLAAASAQPYRPYYGHPYYGHPYYGYHGGCWFVGCVVGAAVGTAAAIATLPFAI